MAKRTNWLTPLNIPERKVGSYAIKHRIIPAGEKVMLSNFRNRMLGGQQSEAFNLVYDKPTRWHELVYSGGVWMSDLPVEQRQHDELLKGMHGTVLVGGLGLGYAVHKLKKMRRVRQIVVVEISKEVIDLTSLHAQAGPGGHKVEIVQADLLKWLKDRQPTGRLFDTAFYDIWQRDGEDTFFKVVCPLLESSRKMVNKRPVCWNEDVMRGQLYHSVLDRVMKFRHPEMFGGARPDLPKPWEKWPDPSDSFAMWWDWTVPFFEWWHKAERSEQETQMAALAYAQSYGWPPLMESWLNSPDPRDTGR